MLIRNIIKPAPQPQAARGFTLIEFMVASSLGLVVLLAIGTTYGITARMRRAAEAREAVAFCRAWAPFSPTASPPPGTTSPRCPTSSSRFSGRSPAGSWSSASAGWPGSCVCSCWSS